MSKLGLKIKNLKLWQHIFGKEWTRWLRIHHIFDWITVIVIFAIAGLLTLLVAPVNRFLPSNSTLVNYPVKPDIVPNWALFVIALAVPLVIFGLAQIWQKRPRRHDFHHATLGVFTAFVFTNMIVTIIKLATGRYRPNYQENDTLASNWDERSSFPSGHSALSFSSMVFVSLYIAGKFRIFHDHSGSLVLKGVIVLAPLALSFFTAISRVIDYHHDFSDIEAGALIGSGIGIFCYFLWYHSLFSDQSGVPRTHPIEDPILPTTNPASDDKVGMQQRPPVVASAVAPAVAPAAAQSAAPQTPMAWMNGQNVVQRTAAVSGPQ